MLFPADDQQIDAGYATRMRPASRYKKIYLLYYIKILYNGKGR